MLDIKIFKPQLNYLLEKNAPSWYNPPPTPQIKIPV